MISAEWSPRGRFPPILNKYEPIPCTDVTGGCVRALGTSFELLKMLHYQTMGFHYVYSKENYDDTMVLERQNSKCIDFACHVVFDKKVEKELHEMHGRWYNIGMIFVIDSNKKGSFRKMIDQYKQWKSRMDEIMKEATKHMNWEDTLYDYEDDSEYEANWDKMKRMPCVAALWKHYKDNIPLFLIIVENNKEKFDNYCHSPKKYGAYFENDGICGNQIPAFADSFLMRVNDHLQHQIDLDSWENDPYIKNLRENVAKMLPKIFDFAITFDRLKWEMKSQVERETYKQTPWCDPQPYAIFVGCLLWCSFMALIFVFFL